MGEMDNTYYIEFLEKEDFDSVISLGNKIFGDGYLSQEVMSDVLKKSVKDGTNCSYTLSMSEGDGIRKLIGFRLTYAPGQWLGSYPFETHPELWGFDPDKVAYMKSNCLDAEFRGKGFGRMLLDHAIGQCRRAGADAALAHIWMNSPGNSAYKYFSRAGGKEVIVYPEYWSELHSEEAPCIHCGNSCICPAAEMIIDFSTHEELKYV
jgi:ribosomal protein S18 acetylase RimI-like enzyme